VRFKTRPDGFLMVCGETGEALIVTCEISQIANVERNPKKAKVALMVQERITASKYGRASGKHLNPRAVIKKTKPNAYNTTIPMLHSFSLPPHHCCCCPELGGFPNILLKAEGVLDVPLVAAGFVPNPNAAGPAAPGLDPNVDALPNGDV